MEKGNNQLIRFAALVPMALLCMGFAGPYEDLVEERTRPAGRVCLEGDSCGRGASSRTDSMQQVASGPRTGRQVYDAGCAVCHTTGVGGAHVLGNTSAWQSLLAKGRDMLLQNVIRGVGAMPARGVCINCSDDEIAAALDYMIEEAGLQ